MKIDRHFVLAGMFAFALAPSAARAGDRGAGPCEALVAEARQALSGPVPAPPTHRKISDGAWTGPRTSPAMELVTPACRAETRRGANPAAASAARALAERREPGWIEYGRILLCRMQDPGSLGDVAGWMADAAQDQARAVCASELATWSGAEQVRGEIFACSVRRRAGPSHGDWEIDPAIVAGAYWGTPELRDQLVPVVEQARAHHAVGYDPLRFLVCMKDETMSAARADACSRLPVEAEEDWWQSGQTRRFVATGVATAIYAGAITAAAVERREESGRMVATGAGVPMGAVFGIAVLGGAVGPVVSRHKKNGTSTIADKVLVAGGLLIGGIGGGILGGLATHALAQSPGARAPVTAVALVPVYLTTIFMMNVDLSR